MNVFAPEFGSQDVFRTEPFGSWTCSHRSSAAWTCLLGSVDAFRTGFAAGCEARLCLAVALS